MSCISQHDLWIFPALAVLYQQLEACGLFKDLTESKAVFICWLWFRPGTKYCDVGIRQMEQLQHIIILCFSTPKWTHGTWTAVALSPGTLRPAASSMSKVPNPEVKLLWVYMWRKKNLSFVCQINSKTGVFMLRFGCMNRFGKIHDLSYYSQRWIQFWFGTFCILNRLHVTQRLSGDWELIWSSSSRSKTGTHAQYIE